MRSSIPVYLYKASRLSTFGHALFFVGGFSLVFILGWGGGATLVGQVFSEYELLLGRIGGIAAILFGLVTLGILQIPWLFADTRPQMQHWGANRLINSALFGVLFAAGWTPCIGATLGAILALGFNQETASQAMVLSSGYSLGLGLPFLGLAILLESAQSLVNNMRRHVRVFQWISGMFLFAIGVLMHADRITLIAIWAQSNGLFLDLPLGGVTLLPF